MMMPDTASSHGIVPGKQSPVTRSTHAEAKLHRLREVLTLLEAQRTQLSEQCQAAGTTNEENDDDNERTEQVVSQALAAAKKTNQDHIRLLTQYNDIKDVATSLMGMIAEDRQKRIVEVMQDFEVDEKD